MAAAPTFNELALKYVLADKHETDKQQAISEQAAQAIEQSSNKRLTVGQWVASVHEWMQSSGDDDLISRAKALDFLASTLQILSRRDDTLNADQVKLLVTFFCSLFENDHKAGIAASTKALSYLIVTKHFQPSLGSNIIQSICKLGDDFKLQLPATRLGIYQLFRALLGIPAVVSDLEHQHGSTSGFILDLQNLCRNERDPENLMTWFAILKSFLQEFNPSDDVTSEIFRAFSAYFPISLRPSTTPTVVTTDDLKSTLRSCFSAHHRVAGLSIPFLVDQLDKADQTIAVKVDILLTLDACLMNYDRPQQSVVPYADQIWGSLKYEVRNGDVQDIIKATLKVLCSLAKRLEGENLQSFIDNAWRDLKEDISDLKYTAQAGNLLVAVIGATPQSFALLVPRALEHIKKTIENNTMVLHKRDLIALMNSIVKLRLHLVSDLYSGRSQSEDVGLLLDDLFGDSLFHDLYLPFWKEHYARSSPIEYLGLLGETLQGMGSLVGLKSSGKGRIRRLCSDSTCKAIVELLAQIIISPLTSLQDVSLAQPQDLLDAAEVALKNSIPLYPPSFRYLLPQYLSAIEDAYSSPWQSPDLSLRIWNVSTALCTLIHSGTLDPSACWLNEAALINALLQGLQWMLSKGAHPRIAGVLIDVLHTTVTAALEQASTFDTSPKLTKQSFRNLVHEFRASRVPQIDLNQPGMIEVLGVHEVGSNRPRRAYCLFVVQQLYRRFTTLTSSAVYSRGSSGELAAVNLSNDIDDRKPDLIPIQNKVLAHIGQLAATVIRSFSEDEQRALELDSEAFSMFHSWNSDSGQNLKLLYSVSPANNFRTAPLALGIIQGLRPGAIDTEIHLSALKDLVSLLVTSPTLPPDALPRPPLDALLAVLSNKLDKKNSNLMDERLRIQQCLMEAAKALCGHDQNPGVANSKLLIWHSIMCYLAGDIACPLIDPAQNRLLTFVFDHAPNDTMMGRQLAQYLGVMVKDLHCLSKPNHAIRKKLAMGWLYHRYVEPLLDLCISDGWESERSAVHRSIATFELVRHMKFHIFKHDVAKLVRIGIRSLSTFHVGPETAALLVVLNTILDEDPDQLQNHLTALIKGLASLYEAAIVAARANTARRAGVPGDGSEGSSVSLTEDPVISTRWHVVRFFSKFVEKGYATHILVPHAKGVKRLLATACGDPVREIRRNAVAARRAWDAQY
ncbi:Dos2-interacting transcription regulator of RNA-Pol-II-domain-containing protein [Nemania sp. FL0031]|nr:Dos2-interacting transcription regulator of RNA-Pol-II-domain-containing protein [Nemania sp. FL0031]